MREEIKEILTWLNDKDYYIEDFGYKFKRLSLEENEELLDYITNLQEEIERLNNQIKEILEIAKEQDKENVNLIDRLENILGVDKE